MSKFVMPDGREYPFSLPEITMREAKQLQEVAGIKYDLLVYDLQRGNPDGKAAFLWFAMRKADHHIPFDEVYDLPQGGVKFFLEEPDPTKASAETPKAESTSPESTKSVNGRHSTQKSKPTKATA